MKRVHTISLVNSCSLSPSFCSFSSSRSPTFHFLLFLSLLESSRPFSRRISSGSSFPAVNGQRGRKGEREQIRGETKLRVKPFPSLYRPLSLSLSLSHSLPFRSLSLSLVPSSVLVIQTPSMNLLLLSFLVEEASSPRFFSAPLLRLSFSLSRSRRPFFLPYL